MRLAEAAGTVEEDRAAVAIGVFDDGPRHGVGQPVGRADDEVIELAAELAASGIRNYSLWLRDDGLEFGYLECDDWEQSCAYLAKSQVHGKWQAMMQDYLDSGTDTGQGGQPIELLETCFQLLE